MEPLINTLRKDFPNLTFVRGKQLCWSPETREIYFNPGGDSESILGVLHEIGHALLGHTGYQTDIELLQKEVLAWHKARTLANKYRVPLLNADSHIEDCLDSYREWLYRRSMCPECGLNSIQNLRGYYCVNCANSWSVSRSRFCRPYRNKISQNFS